MTCIGMDTFIKGYGIPPFGDPGSKGIWPPGGVNAHIEGWRDIGGVGDV